MGRLAFTHPGKLGDAIYTLPAIRWTCNHKDTTADFYTSEYCRPLKRLFEYQSCVDNVYFPDNYKIERMDMGVQPWYIPVDRNLYDVVWQLGFRQVPDRPLPNFIGVVAGIPFRDLQVEYEYPEIKTIDEPYIVIAPRGKTVYEPMFLDIIEESKYKVVQVGGHGDAVGNVNHPKIIDLSGLDMLETTSWIAGAKGFVGIMSAMLVLANGFDMPKISPHDGVSWDMRHVVESDSNFYPINPTAEEVLGVIR